MNRCSGEYLCGYGIVQIITNGLLYIFFLILTFAFIDFLITFGFYLVYNNKNDEHPWKHAIKRSRPWWIFVLLLPFIVIGVGFLLVK